MVATLIEQMFHQVQNRARLFAILEPEYRRLSPSACPSEVLWKLFSTIVEDTTSDVVILVDALDECVDPCVVIEKLGALKARTIITSRPEPLIVGVFEKSQDVLDIAMDVRADITSLVAGELENTHLERYQEQIMLKVMGGRENDSDGHFLYARLVLNALQESSGSTTNLPEIIDSLPSLLEEMYELLISNLPRRAGLDLIRRMTLTFVSVAKNPPSVEEVSYAVAANGRKDFDPSETVRITEKSIREACGSLITIRTRELQGKSGSSGAQLKQIRFTHLVVKNFVLNHPEQTLSGTALASQLPLNAGHVIRLHCCMAYVCG